MHRHRAVYYSARVEERRGAAARTHAHARARLTHDDASAASPARTRGETRWRRRITSRPTPVASVMHPIEYSTGDGSAKGGKRGSTRNGPQARQHHPHGPYDEQPAPCICARFKWPGMDGMLPAMLKSVQNRGGGGNNESSRITRLLVCSARVNIRSAPHTPLLPLCLSWFLTPRCFPFFNVRRVVDGLRCCRSRG